jgi:hypothetical protein
LNLFSVMKMLEAHVNHLQSEGFSDRGISILAKWGVRSIGYSAARKLGIIYQGETPAGLWFPFQQGYGQLRCDRFTPKYLSPGGRATRPWNPHAQIVTEGYKDAAAGTLMGKVPTAAIAGVTHYQSLSPSGQTVIFDSDATMNPHVFTALIRAALFLNGKALVIPREFGDKAGLCEFFQRFTPKEQPEAYQSLLATAMTPREMLYHLPSQWKSLSIEQRESGIHKLMRLVYDFPEIINDRRSITEGASRAIEHFCAHVSDCCGYPLQQLLARFPIKTERSANHDRTQINHGIQIPIEICLSRSNREALDGVTGNRNCTAFNIAADLCGIATLLDSWGQSYSDPRPIFQSFGRASEMSDRELTSVWRSAEQKSCQPALPVASIQRNISYWQYKFA